MNIILIGIIAVILAGCQTYKPLMGMTEADDATRLEQILGVDVKRIRWCLRRSCRAKTGKKAPLRTIYRSNRGIIGVKQWIFRTLERGMF